MPKSPTLTKKFKYIRRAQSTKKSLLTAFTLKKINPECQKKLYLHLLKLQNSIKKELINFFITCRVVVRRNKDYFIQHILKIRQQSAQTIQKNFRISYIKHRLLTTAHKHSEYYSIYPSFDINDNDSISLKLFLNLKDPEKYRILPCRFCPIRNCYSFDIPKKKFPGKKKNMYFNFIKNNEVLVDEAYNNIEFGNETVNQVDFNLYEKQDKKLDEICNEIIEQNKNQECSDSDSEVMYDIENKTYDEEISKLISPITQQKLNKNISMKNSLEQSYTTTASSFTGNLLGESMQKPPRVKRSKSILKNKKLKISNKSIDRAESTKVIMKRVSFGIVKFSY